MNIPWPNISYRNPVNMDEEEDEDSDDVEEDYPEGDADWSH